MCLVSLFCVIARKVSGEKGGSYEGVSSLTMALTVVLLVKAGLLCIALVAILHRYTIHHTEDSSLPTSTTPLLIIIHY